MIKKLTSDGFTLMELLLAAAVLAFSLSVILLSFINSGYLNEASRNKVKSVTHAEFVMESIKATAFSDIPSNMGGASWSTWTLNTTAVSNLGLTALKDESITTTLTGTNPIDISVTVSWSNTGGRSQTTTLRTLIAG